MANFCQKLAEGAKATGLFLEENLKEKLALHWQMLVRANAGFNLTAITAPETAAEKHYLDCLIAGDKAAAYLPKEGKVADIGSGGGFPGLVMAAAQPKNSFLLIESSHKKAAFLEECAIAMGLADLEVLPSRVEEAGQNPGFRGGFDLVIARAVAELAVLAEYALPLLRPGGLFFAMKGPEPQEESASAAHALARLGGMAEAPVFYELPFCHERRSLIIVRKIAPTPDKYPRRPGVPAKRPL